MIFQFQYCGSCKRPTKEPHVNDKIQPSCVLNVIKMENGRSKRKRKNNAYEDDDDDENDEKKIITKQIIEQQR